MGQTTYFLEEPEMRHRKKSKAKGLARSKHKHCYETVLLTTEYTVNKTTKVSTMTPTKVCTICGRINSVDLNPVFYVKNKIPNLPFPVHDRQLSPEALKLDKWHGDLFGKFAVKVE